MLPRFFDLLFGTKRKILIFLYSLLVAYLGLSQYRFIRTYFNLGYMTSRKFFHFLGYIFFAPGIVSEVLCRSL